MLRTAVPVAAVMLALLAGVGGRAPQPPPSSQVVPKQPARVDLSTLAGRQWAYYRLLAENVKPG